MSRLKLTRNTIATRAQADDALGEIRGLTIARNQLRLERDAAVKSIDDCTKERLEEIDADLQVKTELLRSWAEANPAEFGPRKSIDLIHGTLGWRTGMPKLVKKTKETWEALVDKVASAMGEMFVRTKREVDKQAILVAASTDAISTSELRLAGLSVVQEEVFYVDPKIDEPENRQTA